MAVVTFAPTHILQRTLREAPCLLYAAIQWVATTFSFTDFFLSLNRFVAICLPHHYNFWKNPKVSVLMVFLSWLLPAIVAGTTIAGIGARLQPLPDGSCETRALNWAGTFSTYLMGIFPYSMVGLVSVVIFITAFLKSRSLTFSSSATARYHVRMMKRRLLVAKAMAVLLVWSVASCLPFLLIQALVPGFPDYYPNTWQICQQLCFSDVNGSSGYRCILRVPKKKVLAIGHRKAAILLISVTDNYLSVTRV
ncbi:hypothetical protein RvY_06648 [Ramazzottius varieornatus]|uniref:G-protein coupled receptors family 1 profile domain-containing protein n=1 Tax=Ramazzottius varieornatus TaxID=947166 RepID=A0A1D1V4S5_RAMVA|nr:hypothetical protein RvY_06648 [Ramazzottius varieornatus]